MTALVTFCEAPADFRAVRILVDRVLREGGADWLRDLLESTDTREGLRPFLGPSSEHPFYDVHYMPKYRHDLEKKLNRTIRVPQGHFSGKPGAAMATLARTIFHFTRALATTEEVGAVLIVVDMDNDEEGRREGLEQARAEATSWGTFRIASRSSTTPTGSTKPETLTRSSSGSRTTIAPAKTAASKNPRSKPSQPAARTPASLIS